MLYWNSTTVEKRYFREKLEIDLYLFVFAMAAVVSFQNSKINSDLDFGDELFLKFWEPTESVLVFEFFPLFWSNLFPFSLVIYESNDFIYTWEREKEMKLENYIKCKIVIVSIYWFVESLFDTYIWKVKWKKHIGIQYITSKIYET